MPIYEYRCSSCGAEHEVLQKISDPLEVKCPACGKDALVKMVSAAGFQLKGSGWYVTDFRNGSKPSAKSETKSDAAAPSDGAKTDGGAKKDAGAGAATKSESSSASTASAPSTPAKPASSE
ncbi:MAG TPA: zinc ribbon domain-containing protein [Casimicrobiaceae bacterium]|nr:zinc ribbon domain-containing protein [Casimicrobiaceae bacterium]